MSYCFRWPYCQNRGASAKITIRINISRSDTPRLGGGCGGGVLFVRAMVIGSCVLCMEKGKDFNIVVLDTPDGGQIFILSRLCPHYSVCLSHKSCGCPLK